MVTDTTGYTNPYCYKHLIIDRYRSSRDEYEEHNSNNIIRCNIDTSINNRVLERGINSINGNTNIHEQNHEKVNYHFSTV